MAKGKLYDSWEYAPRDKKVISYLTEGEFDELEKIVLEHNISKSDYVRERLFENPVEERLKKLEEKIDFIYFGLQSVLKNKE